jgi:hypothetical protein
MAKVSEGSEDCIRNMARAMWQRRETVDTAFEAINASGLNMTSEMAEDVHKILGYVASRKYSVEVAVEEIIELIEA